MDLLSILQTNEPGRLLISYKGSEDARKAWEAKLLLFFEKGATSWKRQGRQFPFPLNVRFPIKFTLFDQSLILGATNPVGRKWNEIAFLHLFLMNPSSIDDYRNSVRNEVSEWFSLLNSVEGSQWLIIYDSSKARDRKNRGAVLERIKNDFPKFMDRIFEIYEGSLQTGHALELLVQSKLLNAVDSFVSYQEVQLSAKKEHFKDEDFDFIAYCTMQMNLSWLYHSLGILEHVLAKFDELDALLSLIVSHFSSTGNIPKWLASQANSIGHGCPLLMASIALKSPHEEMTLVELRTLFLAHQISFSLRIYYERIKHGSEPAQPNIKQLKTDFAAIILRYANHCLSSVYENLAALKLSYEPMELRCWTLAFCIEVSQFVGSLTESSLIENASHFACMLSVQKCHAITALSRMSRPEMSTYLSEWFESGVRRMVNSVDGSQAVSELRCLLTDETQIAHYMQKYHEGSIALLKHCDWKRQSMFMGWQLANFLL
ncbi:hypothetical protein AB6A40_001613 [Gnathostoma spinigerum]|uniref:TRAPPC10/Trs130 N-terminal domain-containing protein n=1 Tax=Gnathostoma spinigerum TaxID=75299 RepID=A0ABD6E9T1_9BILA